MRDQPFTHCFGGVSSREGAAVNVDTLGNTFGPCPVVGDPLHEGDPCVIAWKDVGGYRQPVAINTRPGVHKHRRRLVQTAEGIWAQGQGFPDLLSRSRGLHMLRTPDEGATVIGPRAIVVAPEGEPPLGLVVIKAYQKPSLAVWMVGYQDPLDGKYYQMLRAYDTLNFSPQWQRKLGPGRTAEATFDYIDYAGHLFLDEETGLLVAVGRFGADGRRISLVDANGRLLSTLDVSWELENVSVGGGMILRGYQTQRGDLAGHAVADNLMRTVRITTAKKLAESWTYDVKSRTSAIHAVDAECNSNGPGTYGIGGRWPIDVTSIIEGVKFALVFSSGWEVPSNSPEDAYMSRDFNRVGAGGIGGNVLDPGISLSTGNVERASNHREQYVTIEAIRCSDGVVVGTWSRTNSAVDNQYENVTIDSWNAYGIDATFSHSPAIGISVGAHAITQGTFIGFADHQAYNIGYQSVSLSLGSTTTRTSTCPGDDPLTITDEYTTKHPYVEPGAGFSDTIANGGTFQSSISFSYPDYQWFAPGGAILLPFTGGALYPDDPTKSNADLVEWKGGNKQHTVGGCMVQDPVDRCIYACYMEQEAYIQGQNSGMPFQPEESVTASDAGQFCDGTLGGTDINTHIEITYCHWYIAQVARIQHCCRTRLVKLSVSPPGSLTEEAFVDVGQRFDYYVIGSPDEAGPLLSDFQRSSGDNVYNLALPRGTGKLLMLRDLRDSIEGGVAGLPYRAIDVFNTSDLSLVTTLVLPEYLDTVTVASVDVRKWATCGWSFGPVSVSNPPNTHSGTLVTDAEEVPWVAFEFDVLERFSDGTTKVWHRIWRLAWLDGVDNDPTVAVLDYDDSADLDYRIPNNFQEWAAVAFADDLAIWGSSVRVGTDAGQAFFLNAMRLPE